MFYEFHSIFHFRRHCVPFLLLFSYSFSVLSSLFLFCSCSLFVSPFSVPLLFLFSVPPLTVLSSLFLFRSFLSRSRRLRFTCSRYIFREPGVNAGNERSIGDFRLSGESGIDPIAEKGNIGCSRALTSTPRRDPRFCLLIRPRSYHRELLITLLETLEKWAVTVSIVINAATIVTVETAVFIFLFSDY